MVDVWILLIMHSFGGSFSKIAGALVKKKVADASFSCDLLRRALVGHQARTCEWHVFRATILSATGGLIFRAEVYRFCLLF